MRSTAAEPEVGAPGQRSSWVQGLIVTGAFLSALGVVYAADVVPALASAVVFFLFYRKLAPPARIVGQQPAPEGPDEREQRRTAA